MTLQETREKLQHGDAETISEITGFTKNYISLVLNAKRKNMQIIDVANQLVNDRELLKASLKTKFPKP